MTMVVCEFCRSEYPEAEGPCHDKDACIAALVRERGELRSYLAVEGSEHLCTENKCLRSALARSENEKILAMDALSRVQARCTELLKETRLFKGGAGEPDG